MFVLNNLFILYRCLEKNPEHRPFMMELEEHPFIQSVPENDFHVRHLIITIIAIYYLYGLLFYK